MEKRKRIASNGRPRPCVVRIHPAIAATIYRERLDGLFPDETDLVNSILREWAKGLPPVDWPALKERLQAEELAHEPATGAGP